MGNGRSSGVKSVADLPSAICHASQIFVTACRPTRGKVSFLGDQTPGMPNEHQNRGLLFIALSPNQKRWLSNQWAARV